MERDILLKILSKVKKIRTALSAVQNSSIKMAEIPYSNFTYNSENKSFEYANPDLGVANVKGFIIRPTNGGAILQAYVNSNATKLSVVGWIPSTGDVVTGDYIFKCYAVGD